MSLSKRRLWAMLAAILASFGAFLAYVATLPRVHEHAWDTGAGHTEAAPDAAMGGYAAAAFDLGLNTCIVLSVAAMASAGVFLVLSLLLSKRITKGGLVISAVAAFGVTLPLSGIIGPTSAVIFGAATGSTVAILQKIRGQADGNG